MAATGAVSTSTAARPRTSTLTSTSFSSEWVSLSHLILHLYACSYGSTPSGIRLFLEVLFTFSWEFLLQFQSCLAALQL